MNIPAILRALLGIALLGIASPAAAATPAVQDYAQQAIDQGIAILKDRSLSPPARHARLDDFLQSLLDMKRIGLFTLGSAAQTASPSELAAYLAAFQTFTLANYEAQIGAYGGQSLKVTGAIEHGPGDYVVTAIVIDPSAPANADPTSARFRIVDEGKRFALVDASVEGVWFEVALHDGIQGFLGQNGNSIPKLIDHLNQMTAGLSRTP